MLTLKTSVAEISPKIILCFWKHISASKYFTNFFSCACQTFL